MQTLTEKVESLKKLLLQGDPVMIFGPNFMAFNYGDSELPGDRDSLVTSEFGHARISRKTGIWTFRPEPHIPLRNASHFQATRVEVDLSFNQLKEEIEKQS